MRKAFYNKWAKFGTMHGDDDALFVVVSVFIGVCACCAYVIL